MGYKQEELHQMAQEVLEEFVMIEAAFGRAVTRDEERAILFAVEMTANKSIPF